MKKKTRTGSRTRIVVVALVVLAVISIGISYVRQSHEAKACALPSIDSRFGVSDSKIVKAGCRVMAANSSFSLVPAGGWDAEVFDGQNAIASLGSCIDNSCRGGFENAPDKPIALMQTTHKLDVATESFAIFSDNKSGQEFTNAAAEKSGFRIGSFLCFGGIKATRYHQTLGGGDIYEYSFKKNGNNYHIYYRVGNNEKNQLKQVQKVIGSLKFY